MSTTVPPNHTLAELLAKYLHGIGDIPPRSQRRVINHAIREAVKWHKKEVQRALELDRVPCI